MIRAIFIGLVVVLGAAGIFFYAPDTDPAAMTAKYTNANSDFVDRGDGFKIHYRDEGNALGTPLVLVHGTSASLHVWEAWVAELGDEFRLISLDLPGHGLTGPNPEGNYSIESLSESITIVTEHLGIDEFAIAGNSLGGQIAWHYALGHPEAVTALVLLNSGGVDVPNGEKAKGNIGFAIMQHPIGRYLAQSFTPRFLIEKSVHQSFYNQSIITDAMVDRYWELLRFPGNRKALAQRVADWGAPQDESLLSAITQPTLIIWGRHDALIPVASADVFQQTIPDARTIIYEEAGHGPMEELAQQSALDTREFLRASVAAN